MVNDTLSSKYDAIKWCNSYWCIILDYLFADNIQVKFYEETDKGLEIWKAYGKFTKLDVHHQYAIVFK
jgi:hypothetical protein